MAVLLSLPPEVCFSSEPLTWLAAAIAAAARFRTCTQTTASRATTTLVLVPSLHQNNVVDVGVDVVVVVQVAVWLSSNNQLISCLCFFLPNVCLIDWLAECLSAVREKLSRLPMASCAFQHLLFWSYRRRRLERQLESKSSSHSRGETNSTTRLQPVFFQLISPHFS